MSNSAFARVLVGLTVVVVSAGPSAADSPIATAQVLIIIPERPDLAEAEARAEGRAFTAPAPVQPTVEQAPIAQPSTAPRPPVELLPPPLPRALQRVTTVEHSGGQTQLLHTQIEPI
jgi:hypothetical protein